jgi:hypothetical protein
MKMYFEIRIVLTALFFLVILVGCGCEGNSSKIGLAVLVDVTEGCEARTLITEPGIKDAFGIHDEADFSPSAIALVTEITGVDIRPVKPFRLDGKSAIENPTNREEAVSAFVSGIFDAVRDTSNGCFATEASSIFKPLKMMAERLASDSTLSRRIIVLVTDGIENSRISFLKSRDFDRDISKTIAKLEQAYGEFPSIQGFEIILVHQPVEGDLFGNRGIEFWKTFLESKGATVQLSASL